MGRLLLIRHGESEGNRDSVFTRSPAVGLTDRGREQARQAGAWLREHYEPARLVSSPFTRARQTADLMAAAMRIGRIEVEQALRERSYGEMAGLPYTTPRHDYDRSAYWSWRPPSGETLEEVALRVGPVLDRVARDGVSSNVVVVSHGAVMTALWWHMTGDWPKPGSVVRNAGVVLVEHRGDHYDRVDELEGP